MLHGGQLRDVKKQFPNVIEPWLDLSTGINPYSYPLKNIPTEFFENLPRIESEEALKQAAILKYGLKHVSLIAMAPGTQILISLLPYILPVKQVCVFSPTYMEHITSWEAAGFVVYQVSNIEQFIFYLSQQDTACVICNPNNPNGHLFTSEQIKQILLHKHHINSYLIIDEAFMDFEGEGMANALPNPGLIILRSFGKTYGLAGIRLGFILANDDLIQKIQIMLGPWPVNGAALYIANQALRDHQWFLETQEQLFQRVQELDTILNKNNMKIIGGTSLFRLIEYENAATLWEYLASRGILVRKFSYNSKWLRFGLAREKDWIRIQQTLNNYFMGLLKMRGIFFR